MERKTETAVIVPQSLWLRVKDHARNPEKFVVDAVEERLSWEKLRQQAEETGKNDKR